MATVQQLLTRIDELYYNTSVSIQTKIGFMNMALDDLTKYFGKIMTDSTLVTVIDQDEYTFPTGMTDISEIECLDIGNAAVPTTRYDYTRYVRTYQDNIDNSGFTYRQVYSSTGVKSLIIYPVPTVAGYPIRIRYRKRLAELTSTSAGLLEVPEFDSSYHDLLAFYAAYMMCSTGASPDYAQSDRFIQSYNDGLGKLWRNESENKLANPRKQRDNRMWRSNR